MPVGGEYASAEVGSRRRNEGCNWSAGSRPFVLPGCGRMCRWVVAACPVMEKVGCKDQQQTVRGVGARCRFPLRVHAGVQ